MLSSSSFSVKVNEPSLGELWSNCVVVVVVAVSQYFFLVMHSNDSQMAFNASKTIFLLILCNALGAKTTYQTGVERAGRGGASKYLNGQMTREGERCNWDGEIYSYFYDDDDDNNR